MLAIVPCSEIAVGILLGLFACFFGTLNKWLFFVPAAMALIGDYQMLQDYARGLRRPIGTEIAAFCAVNLPLIPAWMVCSWYDRWKVREKRLALGSCLNCGYNLTGNVSGVCPECGERI